MAKYQKNRQSKDVNLAASLLIQNDMGTSKPSFLYKAYNPVMQAAIVFVAGFVVMSFAKILSWTGIFQAGQKFPWMTAAAFILFYAIFNSITSLSSKNLNNYWLRSMLAFACLAVASGFLAYLFSSLTIGEAGSYRWIFKVLTFGYLVFLSILGFMKRIVEFAEKEDWQAPKKRKKR